MCTRIAELAYAPFRFIGEHTANYIENASLNTKITDVALSIFSGFIQFSVTMYIFSKHAIPLSTALANAFVIGFGWGFAISLVIVITHHNYHTARR